MMMRNLARMLKYTMQDTVRTASEFCGIQRYSKPGLYGLDDKLSPYLDFRDGFFIECGANDGFRQSNTYFLERFRNWTGLLIEPVPELHARCCRLRRRSTCVQCALVGSDYPFAEIGIQFAGLMSVAEGAFHDADRARRHVEEGLRLQGLATRELKVPACTLSGLLNQLGISQAIDFLSLDVEGFEHEVLSGIDFLRHRPRYILIEARDPEAIARLLALHYRLIDRLTHHDYLFALR